MKEKYESSTEKFRRLEKESIEYKKSFWAKVKKGITLEQLEERLNNFLKQK